MTTLTAHWPGTPGDPDLAPYIAREMNTLWALLADQQRRTDTATAEQAMAALLGTLED